MPFHPAVVVSPHLDDAVMSCGYLLARTPHPIVVTVFAGLPDPPPPLQPWDADCGFRTSEEALSTRLLEDDAALATLSCVPERLPFADRQYGGRSEDSEIADALAEVLAGAPDGPVAVPLGLFHDDHAQTSRAALSACRAQRRRTHVYGDVPYRRLAGAVHDRLRTLAHGGIALGRVDAVEPRTTRDATRKWQAVHCYRSQLRGLGTEGRLGVTDAFRPEAYWEVAW